MRKKLKLKKLTKKEKEDKKFEEKVENVELNYWMKSSGIFEEI